MTASKSLPLLMALGVAAVLALIPVTVASQELGPGRPTDHTPDDRRAANTPRPARAGAPVNANDAAKQAPPDTDAREVRPAEAFPPERIAPSARDPGAGNPEPGLQADPRSREEAKDPGD